MFRDVNQAFERANDAIGANPFWVIKGVGSSQTAWARNIERLAETLTMALRSRDSQVNCAIMSDGYESRGPIAFFLKTVLGLACERAGAVTCVIEPEHVDDVYRDLLEQVYAKEFYDTSRWSIRLALFACEFDDEEYFWRPGRVDAWEHLDYGPRARPLQDDFMGSIVLLPRRGGVVGRTLLDPRWFAEADVDVRLSDYSLTVRGKRLIAHGFPWRAQEGEVLGCVETSALSIACYFSNEYREYPYTLPGRMLAELSRKKSERVLPTNGLDYDSLGFVLSDVGFDPRRYKVEDLGARIVPGDPATRLDRARRVCDAFVSSGLPVAVNVQPEDGTIGHSVVVIGQESNVSIDWDSRKDFAERVTRASRQGPNGTVAIIGSSDLEYTRRYVTIDDSSIPYALRSWPCLSSFTGMEVHEMLVPTAPMMRLGAMDARDIAGEVFRSKDYGVIALSGGHLGNGERLVLTQRMVSGRSYVRFRVATSDRRDGGLFETATFPAYGWLFELARIEDWVAKPWERRAVAELLLDATSTAHAFPSGRIVLMRTLSFIHYHAADGSIVDDSYERRPFRCFDRSLRHIEAFRKS